MRQSRSAAGRAPRDRNSALFWFTAAFVAIWVLLGGDPPDGMLVFVLLAVSGSALLAAVFASGATRSWSALPLIPRLLIGFTLLMPLAQLIPLPPGWWQALPGRALPEAVLRAAGEGEAWRPLTLTFGATLRTALMFIWLGALMLALLRLSTTELRRIFALLLALGLVHVVIGILQFLSSGSVLQFYDTSHYPFLIGLFANKNHSALFIAMTILTGFAALYGEQGWTRSRIAVVAPVVLVLFAALVATFSRAGLLFGVMALAFVALLAAEKRVGRRGWVIGGAAIVGAGLVAILASTDLAARSFGRFAAVGTDPRWEIWARSWPLVQSHWPVGSGIGSFPRLFGVSEQLNWIMPAYINHVHNEYIEQLLELGVAAPFFWLLVVATMVQTFPQAWAKREGAAGRLALVGGGMLFLFAIHSMFDYPLRRPALAAIAIVALAAFLRVASGSGKLIASRDEVCKAGRRMANAPGKSLEEVGDEHRPGSKRGGVGGD